MLRKRLYVDTSVIGGCFDDEFRVASLRLIERARAGDAVLLVSPITIEELEGAPAEVRAVLQLLPSDVREDVPLTAGAEALRDGYLAAKVVSQKWADDALHVALATIARADLIVSWNFKHMVNVDRVRGFNSVNLWMGFQMIDIRSPLELFDDDENQDV